MVCELRRTERSGGDQVRQRERKRGRGETRSTRCPIWYPATATSAILLTRTTAVCIRLRICTCARSRLPTLPTISSYRKVAANLPNAISCNQPEVAVHFSSPTPFPARKTSLRGKRVFFEKKSRTRFVAHNWHDMR